jgi:GNAT superfamily N-acetyltransferase
MASGDVGGDTGGMSEAGGLAALGAGGFRVASGERVRGVWRELMGAPSAFRTTGWVVAAVPGDERRIGMVRLEDAVAVSAPAELVEVIGEVVVGSAVDLTDPAAVVELLGPVAPVAGVRGPAVLAYADPGCFTPRPGPAVVTVAAGDAGVVGLAAACGADGDESGITDKTSPLSVVRVGGQVAAACGYEVWRGELAQVGVLTHPRFRGRGLGAAVASATVAHALAAGLVVQWRARMTLTASRRIARSLGFVELGHQLTVRLRR